MAEDEIFFRSKKNTIEERYLCFAFMAKKNYRFFLSNNVSIGLFILVQPPLSSKLSLIYTISLHNQFSKHFFNTTEASCSIWNDYVWCIYIFFNINQKLKKCVHEKEFQHIFKKFCSKLYTVVSKIKEENDLYCLRGAINMFYV